MTISGSGARAASLLLLLAAGVAGCGNSQVSAVAGASRAVPVDAAWKNGRLAIDVPVPVVTIGLPDATVAKLQSKLRTYRVDHTVSDFNQVLYPDLEELQEQGADAVMPLGGETWPHPVLPTARYEVTAAPAALVREFA